MYTTYVIDRKSGLREMRGSLLKKFCFLLEEM